MPFFVTAPFTHSSNCFKRKKYIYINIYKLQTHSLIHWLLGSRLTQSTKSINKSSFESIASLLDKPNLTHSFIEGIYELTTKLTTCSLHQNDRIRSITIIWNGGIKTNAVDSSYGTRFESIINADNKNWKVPAQKTWWKHKQLLKFGKKKKKKKKVYKPNDNNSNFLDCWFWWIITGSILVQFDRDGRK